MMLCFLVSAHTGDKRPFYNLVSAMFGAFLCFYLADFTVLNGPQVQYWECCLGFLTASRLPM